MANPLTEAARLGDVIKRELDPNFSRKRVTLKSGFAVLAPFTVLGVITASGKWSPYNPTLSDGTEVAAGILLAPAATATGPLPGPVDTTADALAIVLRGLAVVSTAHLVWGAGVTTAGHKTAAAAALDARQLILVDPV
jgi:hypothetical protein